MKHCSTCGVLRPIDDFHRDKRSRDGHKPNCKECRCNAARDWAQRNPETVRAASNRWAAENRESRRASSRKWAEKNPEKQRAYERDWAAANRDRRYATHKAWRDANPDRRRDYRYRRRAERSTSPETQAKIAELLAQPCAYCGATEDITIDHIVPLTRGGSHEPDNLAAACRPCNSSKGARMLDEWLGRAA